MLVLWVPIGDLTNKPVDVEPLQEVTVKKIERYDCLFFRIGNYVIFIHYIYICNVLNVLTLNTPLVRYVCLTIFCESLLRG